MVLCESQLLPELYSLQVSRAEIVDVAHTERTSVRNNNDSVYPLSEDGVITSYYGAFQNSLESGKYVFDFCAKYLEATAVDYVFLTIEHAHETIGVHGSDIP